MIIWNANGLASHGGQKVEELSLILNRLRPEVCCISETKLDSSFEDGEIEMPMYTVVRSDRNLKRSVRKHGGGGVLLYIRNDIKYKIVVKEAGKDFELIAIDLERSGERIVGMYRRPGDTLSSELAETLGGVLAAKKNQIVVGDINMDTKSTNPKPRKLLTMLEKQFKLKQKARFVTRRESGSTIDHVWTRQHCVCTNLHELGGMSDHEMIAAWTKDVSSVKLGSQKIKRRKWKSAPTEDMVGIIKAEFAQMEYDGRANGGRLKKLMESWDNAWRKIKKKHAPVVEIKIKAGHKRRKNMSEETRRVAKERCRIWKQACKPNAKEETKAEYRKLKKEVSRLYSEEQSQKIESAKEKLKGKKGTKQWWELVDSIKGRKAPCHAEPDCTPDETNKAFVTKIQNIRKAFEGKEKWTPKETGVPELRLKKIGIKEVLEAIKGARNTAAYGVDEIPMTVLKKVGKGISKEIMEITNAILEEAKWPDQWKPGEIKPLWKKKGSKGDPKFYRPVTLLPAISRIVERIIAQQLKQHLKDNGILPNFQHGFRAGHSPETAITQLITQIAKARDEHEIAIVMSLDLAGAFDTIDHEVLCEKLQRVCGVTGDGIRLMQSYLGGRRQRVRYMNGNKSQWAEVKWGVPQGSVWGPLLFVMFCADLRQGIREAEITQFADDITLVVSDQDCGKARLKANAAMEEFHEYAAGNRLAAEPSKTQIMYSAAPGKRKAMEGTCCEMAGQQLQPVKEIKVLGAFLDEQLTGESHNANAAGKSDRANAAIKRIGKFLKQEEKITLAEALAHPHLDYCQNAFFNPTEAATDSVERAFNRTARMITGMDRSEEALGKLKWQGWRHRRVAARKAFVAKIFYGGQPRALKDMFPEKLKGPMQTRAMERGELEEPFTGTCIGSKQFSIWGPRTFNQMKQEQAKVKEGAEGMQGKPQKERKPCKMPSDEFEKQRSAFYGFLDNKYSRKDHENCRDEDDRVQIWTDGSARQTRKGYRAGAGVFYGHGNKMNQGWAVSGNQTNQRAELTAVLRCIEREEQNITICTDSMYVVAGIQQGRSQWKKKAWYKNPGKAKWIDNADLWQKLDCILEVRGDKVKVKWVKGHALPHHIKSGLTTQKDIWGNNQSDVLAGWAAENCEKV